jgi:hypothetical protein
METGRNTIVHGMTAPVTSITRIKGTIDSNKFTKAVPIADTPNMVGGMYIRVSIPPPQTKPLIAALVDWEKKFHTIKPLRM